MKSRASAIVLLGCGLMSGQGLRDLAEPREILIGSGGTDETNFAEAQFAATLRGEFNQIESGNSMKFGPIHPAAARYDFTAADSLVSFAAQHGMRVRGHVFVWHNQIATWVSNGNFSPAQLSDILHQHILTVGGRYRAKVFAWDLVNEAFQDDGTLRDTIWYDQPGIGLKGTAYIEQAFRWAREADPNALLFYNDYSAEWVNPKSNVIYNMAKDFKARGVPIDGIGLQSHFLTSNAGNLSSMDTNIKRLTDLGLQVHITELEVRFPVDANGKATAQDLATQADLYGKFAAICFKYAQCTSLQTWGFTDKYSWIPSTFPGFGAALPLDTTYRPKSAYNALRDAISAAPALTRPGLPAAPTPPAISAAGLVSAASYARGGVTPGEIITLFGSTKGPPALVAASADSTGKRPTVLAETRLLFDGVATPFLYSALGQISAIVPFSVAGKQQTQVEYEYQGIRTNAVTVSVLATKPALFTIDSSGQGPAAALDSNYAYVTRSAPISKGDIVLLFLTGASQTNPGGVDGRIVSKPPLPTPLAKVSATIGGLNAQVLSAGAAVGLVQGGTQVNLHVPEGLASGDQPVAITIGAVSSSPQVTIAVK